MLADLDMLVVNAGGTLAGRLYPSAALARVGADLRVVDDQGCDVADGETGELLCIMDAQYLTTLRTGATSAVAARRLKKAKPCVVSLLGSGAEAYAQLDAMRAAGYVASAMSTPAASSKQASSC